MKNSQQYRLLQVFSLVVISFTISCSDDMEGSTMARKGNYFPAAPGSHWTYEYKAPCESPNEANMCTQIWDARSVLAPLEWDDQYKRIEGAAIMLQFVKVINTEYFGMGYYINEYKFLDDGLPVGSTWGAEESPDFPDTYDRFKILEVNSTKQVKGKKYFNVIVIEQTTSYSGDPVIRNVNYYAKGIGHIYRKQTVTYKSGETHTVEIRLLNYFIATEPTTRSASSLPD